MSLKTLKTPDLPDRIARLRTIDLLWLLQGATWLTYARLVLWWYPVGHLLQSLQSAQQSEQPESKSSSIIIVRVSWAVRVAARVLPFRTDCLIQAMAAHMWLARQNVQTNLWIGARKDNSRGFEAHAWLCYGDEAIIGGDVSGFVPLLTPEITLEHPTHRTSPTSDTFSKQYAPPPPH